MGLQAERIGSARRRNPAEREFRFLVTGENPRRDPCRRLKAIKQFKGVSGNPCGRRARDNEATHAEGAGLCGHPTNRYLHKIEPGGGNCTARPKADPKGGHRASSDH